MSETDGVSTKDLGLSKETTQSFNNSYEFDSPAANIMENLFPEIEAYNGGEKSKNLFSLEVQQTPDDKKWTLKVKPPKGENSSTASSLIELDFSGQEGTKLKTNNNAEALLALQDLKAELDQVKDSFGALRTLVGKKAQTLIETNMTPEDHQNLQNLKEARAKKIRHEQEVADANQLGGPKKASPELTAALKNQDKVKTQLQEPEEGLVGKDTPETIIEPEKPIIKTSAEREAYFEANKEQLTKELIEFKEAIHELTTELRKRGVGESFLTKVANKLRGLGPNHAELNDIIEGGGLPDWTSSEAISNNQMVTSSEALQQYPKLAIELKGYQDRLHALAENLPKNTLEEYFPGYFDHIYPNGLPEPDAKQEVETFSDNDSDTTTDLEDKSLKNDPEYESSDPEYESSEPEYEPTITTPDPITPINEFTATVTSARGQLDTEIEVVDRRGRETTKKLTVRELIEVKAAEFARKMMSETRRKWDPESLKNRPWYERWGQRAATLSERVWRGMLTEKQHYIKEKRHGLNLMSAAGVESDFDYHIFEQIDKQARLELYGDDDTGVKGERDTVGKRIVGTFKDLGNELVGHERDLHRKRVEIVNRYRQNLEQNPLDLNNPIHPLVMRDYQRRTELASRIGETSYDETLHTAMGEKRTESAILLEKDSAPRKFISQEILKPIIEGALASGSPGIDAGLRLSLDSKLNDYWLSDEFQDWRKTLPQADQEKLDISLSYASNIISVAEEVLVPNVLSAKEHYRKMEEFDFDIKLTLGTARFGPNGEIPKQSWGEKRITLNEELFKKLGKEKRIAFGDELIGQGVRHAKFLAFANDMVQTELWAVPAWIGVKALTSTARMGAKAIASPAGAAAHVFAPMLAASGVAGVMAGIKHYGSLSTDRAELNITEALGETRPEDALRAAEMKITDYHRVAFSDRITELQGLLEKEALDKGEIYSLLALTVDSDARSDIGARRNINLWRHQAADSSSSSFQAEEGALDVLRSQAKLKFQTALSDESIGAEITSELGFPVGASSKEIISKLTRVQTEYLERGATVPPEYLAMLQAITPAEYKAVVSQDQAFRKFQTREAIKKGGIVFGTSFVVQVGIRAVGQFSKGEHFMGGAKVEVPPETVPNNQLQATSGNHSGYPSQNSPEIIVDSSHSPELDPTLPDGIGQVIDPETGNVLATMNAYVPPGTHLVPTGIDDTYNLVSENGGKTLIENLHINADGTPDLTENIQHQMIENRISIRVNPLSPIEIGTSTDDYVDVRAGDLGEEGWWGMIRTKLNELNGHYPSNAETNAVKNLVRGYELWVNDPEVAGTPLYEIKTEPGLENIHRVVHSVPTIWGTEHVSAAQSENMWYNHIPKVLVDAPSQEKLAALVREALAQKQAGQELDYLHSLAYKIGYIGGEHEIPTRDEVLKLLDYMRDDTTTTFKPNDILIDLKEDIVAPPIHTPPVFTPPVFTPPLPTPPFIPTGDETIPFVFGYRRPLEAPERPTAPPEPSPYPDYEDYDQYPSYPDYEQYAEYYPEYPEYSEYEQYPEYEEYAAYLPFYEQAYDELGITEDERTTLRKMNPQDRIKEIAKKTNLDLNEGEDYSSDIKKIATKIGIEAKAVVIIEKTETPPDNNIPETKPVIMDVMETVKPITKLLKDNPESHINSQKTVEEYMSLHSSEYINHLQLIDQQIAKPMSKDCKIAVCIPAYHEEKNIYRTLLGYSQQKIDLSNLEIIVLDNHKVGINKDNTEKEVRRFQEEHPELAVHYAHCAFSENSSALGYIRKVSQDIALYRSQQRENGVNDLIVASNDADSYGIQPEAYQWILNQFQNNTELDLVTSDYTYPDGAFKKFPILWGIFKFDRTYKALSLRRQERESMSAFSSSGAVTYYRAGIYAAVGGYDSIITRGSDTNIGKRILEVRTEKSKHSIYSNQHGILQTDPRRALSKMVDGRHWINQWDDKEWQEQAAVTGKDWDDYNNDNLEYFSKERLQEEIQAWINRNIEKAHIRKPNTSNQRYLNYILPKIISALTQMGINAEINNNQLSIIDTSKFEQEYKKHFGIEISKAPPISLVSKPTTSEESVEGISSQKPVNQSVPNPPPVASPSSIPAEPDTENQSKPFVAYISTEPKNGIIFGTQAGHMFGEAVLNIIGEGIKVIVNGVEASKRQVELNKGDEVEIQRPDEPVEEFTYQSLSPADPNKPGSKQNIIVTK